MRKEILILITYLCSIFLAVIITNKNTYDKCAKLFASQEIHDTTFVHDTFTTYVPTYVKYTELDSVLVPITDTLMVRDTLFAYLPQEQVEWKDSLCAVYASGIQPKVDSVKHFQTNMIITVAKPVVMRKHWGFSVGVGPAVIYSPFNSQHVDAGVGLFGGFTYTF